MVLLHNSMLSMGATPRQYMAFVQLYNSIYSNKRKQYYVCKGYPGRGAAAAHCWHCGMWDRKGCKVQKGHWICEVQGSMMQVDMANWLFIGRDAFCADGDQNRADEKVVTKLHSTTPQCACCKEKGKERRGEAGKSMIYPCMHTQAADRRKEVEILKKRQAKEEVELKGRRGGVEEELKGVQPLIDQVRKCSRGCLNACNALKARKAVGGIKKGNVLVARKAVGGIKKENIDEIRSLKMPPDAIRDVLEGVLLVLGQQDTSWNNMKKFLGAKAVKDEVIQRVSVAAAPLASWVKAIMAYSKVLERTAPLEQELSGLVASLQASVHAARADADADADAGDDHTALQCYEENAF
eukprot:scaffold102784_cov18-Tisochrysis_lutea.AAC.1